MAVIKESRWFQPSFFPEHLKHLRGLNVGTIVTHQMIEDGNYDGQLDAIGITHRQVANSGNPNLPNLTANHKAVHRGDQGGAYRDSVKMQDFASDTYNLINGSLVAPITDEFSENYEGQDEWMIQFYVYLFELYNSFQNIQSLNQYKAFGGYGRFQYWQMMGSWQIQNSQWSVLRQGLQSIANAKKGFLQDHSGFYDTLDTSYVFRGRTLSEVSNINYKFYPNPDTGFHANDDPVLKFIYGVEKMGVGWPGRKVTLYTINYSEASSSGIKDSWKGIAYRIDSGILEVKGWSHGYVPGSYGVPLGFFAKLLTDTVFIFDALPLVVDDVKKLDLTQFTDKTWIDAFGNRSAYNGLGGQPIIAKNPNSEFPTMRMNTYLDGIFAGMNMYDQVKHLCTTISHATVKINGTTYTPITGSNGTKVSRYGVQNIGGTTIVDNMENKTGVSLICETVSVGLLFVHYDRNQKRGVVKNVQYIFPSGTYDLEVTDNSLYLVTVENSVVTTTVVTTTGTTTTVVTTTANPSAETLDGSVIIY